MPNTETVRALVSAFNVHNYARNTVKTNFTLHSNGTGSYIVVSFDRGMNGYQCKEYLDSIKRKIVGEFYGIEERDTDEVVLNTANLIFKIESFPFNTSKGEWFRDEQNGFKFVTPADGDVIFNLKSHLASSLKKDVLEGMSACRIVTKVSNKKDCLWHGKFSDKESRKQFEREFLSRMENRYGYRNFFKKPLEVKGDSVYIKDVFDDARFIDSVTRHVAWLKGMGLQDDSKNYSKAKAFKDLIIEFINQSTGLTVAGFIRNFPLDKEKAKILIPVVLDNGEPRVLASEEALKLNCTFNKYSYYAIFIDLYSRAQAELPINGDVGIYGINFSDKEISHCVITKIIESSVINKDHELAIDPERALSPAQSPLNSLTHAGPSGLRTPPNQRKEDRDSGYDSNSPPKKPEGSVAHSSSGGPGPSTELSYMEWESPTRSQDGALKRSPRQGSGKEEEGLLYNSVNLAGTSKGFWPPTQLSYTTVSQGVSGPSSQSVSAAKNVQAGPSTWAQQPNRWSSQGTSGNKWQSSPEPGPSGLSWKGATKNVPAGTSAWSQQPNRWSLPAPSVWSLSQSGPSSWKGAQAGANISEKEEKLIEALLYTLNLTNYTYGGVYTNFFAKDGKIVSLLHDNVDREKYFQAVEEYCKGEEEARGLCDLNEFPFKLNYEEKKGKTVVANISSGALSNLKILFSQKFGKNVDAIDISAVKKVEKREKDEWVDRQLKDSLEEACEGCFSDEEAIEEACQDCFPDEGAMKIIPIAFEGGEYVLDRSGEECEVTLLLREQKLRLRGTSVKPLTEEEKNLFKKLLYAFNLNNTLLECHDTNFIVENGKIASLIDGSVNVEEYLQKVIDKTKEKYHVNEKEEYYVNDFPFKFLPNCEKNQETTVVANISRGALLNLKTLFIQNCNEEKVKIKNIDINIVENDVQSKMQTWVDYETRGKGIEKKRGCYRKVKFKVASATCYPDENALEDIPIGKYETGYRLDRTYENWEVESFLEERRCAKGTSVAEKVNPEDNKDSGISSGEATDAENVSSKAEAITSSGYESMDCENTRGGSPKRSGEEVVQAFKKQCIISTQIEDVTSESFGQRQGSIVG